MSHSQSRTCRRARWLVPVAAVAFVAGCSDDEPTPDPSPESTSAATPSEAATAPVEPTDTASPSDGETSEGGNAAVEPVEVDVDFEERIADGSTFRVTRFEVTDTAVLVDVEIIVAAETAFIQLNHPDDPAVVVDDQGNEYALVPPDGERTLIIDGGEQLEGTLSFQGPLAPGAQSLQLLFNREREPAGETVNDLIQPNIGFPVVELTEGASP